MVRRRLAGAVVIAGVLLGTSGCATGYRLGAMPTMDTSGRVGAHLYVGGDLGLANRRGEHALTMTMEAGGTATDNPGSVGGNMAVGFDFQTVGRNVSGRIGPRAAFGLRTGPGEGTALEWDTLQVGLAFPNDEAPTRWWLGTRLSVKLLGR